MGGRWRSWGRWYGDLLISSCGHVHCGRSCGRCSRSGVKLGRLLGCRRGLAVVVGGCCSELGGRCPLDVEDVVLLLGRGRDGSGLGVRHRRLDIFDCCPRMMSRYCSCSLSVPRTATVIRLMGDGRPGDHGKLPVSISFPLALFSLPFYQCVSFAFVNSSCCCGCCPTLDFSLTQLLFKVVLSKGRGRAVPLQQFFVVDHGQPRV